MELSLPYTLHLFNIFREYDGKENCAKVLEEECIKMFGTKSLNDEHDCNGGPTTSTRRRLCSRHQALFRRGVSA